MSELTPAPRYDKIYRNFIETIDEEDDHSFREWITSDYCEASEKGTHSEDYWAKGTCAWCGRSGESSRDG